MAFRAIVIGSKARLRVHSGQLLVDKGETVSIPLEDIAVLVLEHPEVAVSCAGLSLLASQGVAVVVCDRKHLPSGILLPHCQHSRQLAVVRRQLDASKPLMKRLWERLIRRKIENQARCLDVLTLPGSERLREYKARVLSGDTSGMEAAAARYYFPRLMPGTTRHGGSAHDRALDYGYAIIRAAIARYLAGHGLYPPLGIRHDSQLNSFNLADDLLEPFRPMVDRRVIEDDVDSSHQAGRMKLVGLLHESCEMDNHNYSILTAIDKMVQSLVRALYRKEHEQLEVPLLAKEAAVNSSRITE